MFKLITSISQSDQYYYSIVLSDFNSYDIGIKCFYKTLN